MSTKSMAFSILLAVAPSIAVPQDYQEQQRRYYEQERREREREEQRRREQERDRDQQRLLDERERDKSRYGPGQAADASPSGEATTGVIVVEGHTFTRLAAGLAVTPAGSAALDAVFGKAHRNGLVPTPAASAGPTSTTRVKHGKILEFPDGQPRAKVCIEVPAILNSSQTITFRWDSPNEPVLSSELPRLPNGQLYQFTHATARALFLQVSTPAPNELSPHRPYKPSELYRLESHSIATVGCRDAFFIGYPGAGLAARLVRVP